MPYPVVGSASADTSGISRWSPAGFLDASVVLVHALVGARCELTRPGIAVWYWYLGMQKWVETAPPPAPSGLGTPFTLKLDSFQTTSPRPPLFGHWTMNVPPTAVTYGALAGKLALRLVFLGPPSMKQPVEPSSPEEARTDWPCAAVSL